MLSCLSMLCRVSLLCVIRALLFAETSTLVAFYDLGSWFVLQAVPCRFFVTSCLQLGCFSFVLCALASSLSLNLQKVFWDEVTNPF